MSAQTYKTVAVTGGTGFVGRAVVAALVARGYHVRALVRSDAKAAAVLPRGSIGVSGSGGITLVRGDVTVAGDVSTLVGGCDAVIHLVGIIREVREAGSREIATFEKMHVTATKNVLEACRAQNVKRYVHMSAIGVAGDAKAEYARTKYAAEVAVRSSGLDWTIMRPGLIHGPDGELMQMLHKLAIGDTFPWFVMPYFAKWTDHEEGVIAPRFTLDPAGVAPIHVEDVAEIFVSALERPLTISEIYNLVGPERLNWKSLMEFVRDSLPNTDKTIAAVPVPSAHGAVIATVAKYVGLGNVLPFDAGQALMAGQDSDGDMYKVLAHFGFEPRPFTESVRQYADMMPELR